MHTARDFAVRLRYGGPFPNCGGRANCEGFGVGEHRRGPVCCTAASKAMGKLRAVSEPMHAAGRPPTGGVISRMERPQQNRQSAGDARQTYSGKGRRRRLLEESNAMYHGGFWPIFHAEIVGEEGGEVLFLPLCCFTKVEQKAVRAASRRAQPTRSTTANKACRMGLENKKTHRIGDEKPSCELA